MVNIVKYMYTVVPFMSCTSHGGPFVLQTLPIEFYVHLLPATAAHMGNTGTGFPSYKDCTEAWRAMRIRGMTRSYIVFNCSTFHDNRPVTRVHTTRIAAQQGTTHGVTMNPSWIGVERTFRNRDPAENIINVINVSWWSSQVALQLNTSIRGGF